MKFSNPLDYSESSDKESKCNGMCSKCSYGEFCAFFRAERMKSGYRGNDDRFNASMLDTFAFQTRYSRGNYASNQESFSNPYKNEERNYSGRDYRKALGISDAGGFHGEYSGSGRQQ